mmetsp:Transcript_7323/g.14543  ORF Transcript_7323/g.14543 Transcript_7323/m.14543 type:complete len:483 (-) Transcript_7323:895-2343(-)
MCKATTTMNAATIRTCTVASSIMAAGKGCKRPRPLVHVVSVAIRSLASGGTDADRTIVPPPPPSQGNGDDKQQQQKQKNHHHQQQQQQQQEQQPLCLGYLAGLQCQSPSGDTPWNTFDEAYDLLRQVDPAVLREFETNARLKDGMEFAYATREVSVIDVDTGIRRVRVGQNSDSRQEEGSSDDGNGGGGGGGGSGAIRSLIFNARPKLIQSSIEIERVGAAGPRVWGAPPPLVGPTATHLGGLALTLPLWLACGGGGGGEKNKRDGRREPSAVVLGAGGCTIPAVLAKAGCHVTAVEPSEDVRHAARHYFGASDGDVELLPGFGEDYLMTRIDNNGNQSADTTCDAAIDILIIDAEDGNSAPPASMKEESFWKDVVVPSLSPNGVVAVNVIADHDERNKFIRMVNEVMESHHIWCCEVPSIAKVSNRHSFMFATPSAAEEGGLDIMTSVKEEMDKFSYVDMKLEWTKELENARMFRFYQSIF